MNEASITLVTVTLLLTRNPQATIAVKPIQTKTLNPFPITISEIAIAAKGKINARPLFENCAPEKIARAPMAVKFQM